MDAVQKSHSFGERLRREWDCSRRSVKSTKSTKLFWQGSNDLEMVNIIHFVHKLWIFNVPEAVITVSGCHGHTSALNPQRWRTWPESAAENAETRWIQEFWTSGVDWRYQVLQSDLVGTHGTHGLIPYRSTELRIYQKEVGGWGPDCGRVGTALVK